MTRRCGAGTELVISNMVTIQRVFSWRESRARLSTPLWGDAIITASIDHAKSDESTAAWDESTAAASTLGRIGHIQGRIGHGCAAFVPGYGRVASPAWIVDSAR